MFKIGYYTYYVLDVRNRTEISIEYMREASYRLAQEFFECEDARKYYKERIENSDDPFSWLSDDTMKWYGWENDMLILSSEFPEIDFVLYGEGENRDDNWRAFFKNGDCVYQQAHMYYDPEPVFKE